MKKTLLFLIWSSATLFLQGHPTGNDTTDIIMDSMTKWLTKTISSNSISKSVQKDKLKNTLQSKLITNKPASPTSISLVDSFNEIQPSLGIRRPQSLSSSSLYGCEAPNPSSPNPSPVKPENERVRAYSTESYAGDYVLASISMSPDTPQHRKRIGYQTHPTPPLGNPSTYRSE